MPTAKEAVSRMNALSVGRRQEVLEAARISVCHRQALHLNVAFTDVISKCNKYQTMPDVVSNLFLQCIYYSRPVPESQCL